MCKNVQKMRLPDPPDPLKPIFWLGGMCSKLPRLKNAITLLYLVNLRCSIPIFSKNAKNVRKYAQNGPPGPPETHFLVGEGCVLTYPL